MMTGIIQRLKRLVGIREWPPADVTEEQVDPFLVSQAISRAIVERRPFLASRLGFTEAYCIAQSLGPQGPHQALYDRIWRYSGVFPATEEQFLRFREDYLQALDRVDVLGAMKDRYAAFVVKHRKASALTCRLASLEPYLTGFPWSQHLEGLRVCAVHPFADSIRRQYAERREQIFFDTRVLPAFTLRVVKAPQCLAGNTDGHTSWSAALDWLKKEVMAEDFDVAISGCGAFGLPLGGFIKEQGKICVHLGGAAQTMFGISGAKWRAIPAFRVIMNDAWRPPLESERPEGFEKVEDGCYW